MALALLVVVTFLGCQREGDAGNQDAPVAARARPDAPPAPSSAPKYRHAPPIELMDLEGRPVRLADYAGRPVIVDFWASWCGPCLREVPHWIALRERYAEQGLEILGIAVAERKPIQALRAFVSQRGLPYPVWTGTPETLRDVARRYGGIQSLPTTFFLDRDHRIRARKVGYRNLESLEAIVRELLAAP